MHAFIHGLWKCMTNVNIILRLRNCRSLENGRPRINSSRGSLPAIADCFYIYIHTHNKSGLWSTYPSASFSTVRVFLNTDTLIRIFSITCLWHKSLHQQKFSKHTLSFFTQIDSSRTLYVDDVIRQKKCAYYYLSMRITCNKK